MKIQVIGAWIATLFSLLGTRRLLNREIAIGAPVRPEIRFSDQSALDLVIANAREAHLHELSTGELLATRATTLLSALSISITILIGAGTISLSTDRPYSLDQRSLYIVLTLIICSVILTSFSIYYSFQVLRPTKIARPNPSSLLDIPNESDLSLAIKKTIAQDLLTSYRLNMIVNRNSSEKLTRGYKFALLSFMFIATSCMVAVIDVFVP